MVDATRSDARGASLFSADEWASITAALFLSPREHEIVRGIFDDLTEVSIGRRLGISVHTVHTYVERLYNKLAVRSRVELMVRVFQAHRTVASREHVNGSAER